MSHELQEIQRRERAIGRPPTDPGRLMTDPGRVTTDPGRVATDPRRLVTDPVRFMTDPGRVVTGLRPPKTTRLPLALDRVWPWKERRCAM